MRTLGKLLSGTVLIIFAMLMTPLGIGAQDSVYDTDYAQDFTQEELAQMLAPIALYPDSLIAQILMASTYPLEVVEAERWLRENEGLQNGALNDALEEKAWDPSVKSLCHFPDVLFAMSEKLDQTRKLGDAYLAQEQDVMDTIQMLRRRAEQQGNLQSDGEQTVIRETEYIRIEPADPRVVYVPVYNPSYVYGPWWYPAYPPWVWYPPRVVVTTGRIFYGPSIFIGVGISSWCWFDWPARHIYVHYERSPYYRGRYVVHVSGRHYWRHSPFHRRGVAYRDIKTSMRFGQQRPARTSFDGEKRGHTEKRYDARANEPLRRSHEDRRMKSGERTISNRENFRSGHPTKSFAEKPIESSRNEIQGRQREPEPQRTAERMRPRSNVSRESSPQSVGRGTSQREAGPREVGRRTSSQPTYQAHTSGSSYQTHTSESSYQPHTDGSSYQPRTVGRPMGGSKSGVFQRQGARGGSFRR